MNPKEGKKEKRAYKGEKNEKTITKKIKTQIYM